MNPIILYQFSKKKSISGNVIQGTTGTSTPNQTFSGNIVITTTATLRITVFGGGCGTLGTVRTNGYLTITSPYQSHTVNANAYTTVTKDIILTPGTYPYYGSYSLASGATFCGNNIAISLI